LLNKLNETTNPNYSAEKLKEQSASINRCWGKYAIALLKNSKNKMIKSTVYELHKENCNLLNSPSQFQFSLPSHLYNLNEAEKSAITSGPGLLKKSEYLKLNYVN
jgi:hypothetical protein